MIVGLRMDKLQMAHEHMQNTLKFLHENSINYEFQKIVDESFDYADVMMAEYEKRNNPQPVITEQDKQRAEQAYANIVKPPITEEWKLDWSQAPHPNAVGFKIIDGKVEFLIGHRGVDGKLSVGYSEFNDDWSPIEHYHALHNDYLRKRPTNI